MDTNVPRILLVDDDDDHVALVRRAFDGRRPPVKLTVAASLGDARRQIAESSPELAHVSRVSTMGEIFSELAHEIDQPLYAIVNFAEASTHRLQNGPHDTDEELLGWMRRIFEQANRAGEVIRSLSRFIRKAPPDQAPHDMNTIIREVLRLVEVEAANLEGGFVR